MFSEADHAETPGGSHANVVRRSPVLAFVAVAYVIAFSAGLPEAAASRGWISEDNTTLGLLGTVAAVGPALAAVLVAGLAYGRRGVDGLLQQLFLGASRVRWYGLVVALLVVLSGIPLATTLTMGDAAAIDAMDWSALPVALISILFMLTLWEELGFRGFAQRQWQKRTSPLIASLFVGIIWSLWHFPVLITEGTPSSAAPWPLFILELLGASVVYAWLYNRTAQSVWFVSLLHAGGNAVGLVAFDAGMDVGLYLSVKVPVIWLTAAGLVLYSGYNLGAVPIVRSDASR